MLCHRVVYLSCDGASSSFTTWEIGRSKYQRSNVPPLLKIIRSSELWFGIRVSSMNLVKMNDLWVLVLLTRTSISQLPCRTLPLLGFCMITMPVWTITNLLCIAEDGNLIRCNWIRVLMRNCRSIKSDLSRPLRHPSSRDFNGDSSSYQGLSSTARSSPAWDLKYWKS